MSGGIHPLAERFRDGATFTWGVRVRLAWRMLTDPATACATIVQMGHDRFAGGKE